MTAPANHDALRVWPRALEWLALVFLPPVVWFACYVVLGIVLQPGQDDHAALGFVMRVATWVAIPLSFVVVGWTAWRIGQNAYWRLDADGITQGKWSPQRYAFAEIEALFVGLPDEMSGVGAGMARIPTANMAVAVDKIRAWRRDALVLRLRDRRLLVVGLGAAHFRGGAQFRAALAQRLAPLTVTHEHYTGEERHALAHHMVASKLVRY